MYSLEIGKTQLAHQAPLSMRFSQQEYGSRLPFPSPGDLPDWGVESTSPQLQADSSAAPLGKLQKGTVIMRIIGPNQNSTFIKKGRLHCHTAWDIFSGNKKDTAK